MNSRLSSGLVSKLLIPVVLLFCLLSAQQAKAYHTEDDAADVFYQALAPYGNWVHHRAYGRVWYPRQVRRGWRPYTDGYWAYTNEYGWLWVSDWVWGWVPFHYGRWAWDDWYGWIWVPGTVWAPAWVLWRYGGGYASWAPMPPQYIWNPYVFFSYSPYYFDYDRYVPWFCWVSVRERDFPLRHRPRRLIAPDRNREILKATRPTQNIAVVDNALVNRGVPVKNIEKVTGKRYRPIAPKVLAKSKFPGQDVRSGTQSRDLIIYRPVDNKPTPGVIRLEEQKARQITERMSLQPDLQRGRTPQSGQDISRPNVPGRLTGKPMPLDYQDFADPVTIVPEASRPATPLLTLPATRDSSLPVPGVSPINQRPEEIRKSKDQERQREGMIRRQQQEELQRQRINRETIRQQEEMNRRLHLELERQQQPEQLRLERDEMTRRQQRELERQREAEVHRMEREAAQQRQGMIRSQQRELERQREAEVQRMEREAAQQREGMIRRQRLELERQQQDEQLRLERELIHQQEGRYRQQEMQNQQLMEMEQAEQAQRSRLGARQQREIMRQQTIDTQQVQQPQQTEQSGRIRGGRSVIRGDRQR